jgi:hypothetical protein
MYNYTIVSIWVNDQKNQHTMIYNKKVYIYIILLIDYIRLLDEKDQKIRKL